MTTTTLISKDGRAILELCRKKDITISVAEAEMLAGAMRGTFQVREDGLLRFASDPQENLNYRPNHPEQSHQQKYSRQRARNWISLLQLLNR